LHLQFHLSFEIVLPKNSFTFEGKDYAVPTVWQIWKKQDTPRTKVLKRLRCDAFEFVKRNENPNIAIRRVGVNAGRIFDTDVETRSKQSHHFLKISQENLRRIRTLDLEHCDSKYMTAGIQSLGKSDIVDLWSEQTINSWILIFSGSYEFWFFSLSSLWNFPIIIPIIVFLIILRIIRIVFWIVFLIVLINKLRNIY